LARYGEFDALHCEVCRACSKSAIRSIKRRRNYPTGNLTGSVIFGKPT
jgi:hypothetical protein